MNPPSSPPEQPQQLAQFTPLDQKTLAAVRNFCEKGVLKSDLIDALAGMDDEETWEMRDSIFSESADFSKTDRDAQRTKARALVCVAGSLAGMESERAWSMRQALLAKATEIPEDFYKWIPNAVLVSLAGIDTEQAEQLRRDLVNQIVSRARRRREARNFDGRGFNDIEAELFLTTGGDSYTGLRSEYAWHKRKSLFLREKLGGRYCGVIRSLIGIDDERAWEMREQALLNSTLYQNEDGLVSCSLAGLDSERAWRMREDILGSGNDRDLSRSYLSSLAGIDSAEAWQQRRKMLHEAKKTDDRHHIQDVNTAVARSLAGLDTPEAWALRRKLHSSGVNVRDIVFGIRGDPLTYIGLKAMNEAKGREIDKVPQAVRSDLLMALRRILPRQFADNIAGNFSGDAHEQLTREAREFRAKRLAVADLILHRLLPYHNHSLVAEMRFNDYTAVPLNAAATRFNILDSSQQYTGYSFEISLLPPFHVRLIEAVKHGSKWSIAQIAKGRFKTRRGLTWREEDGYPRII